MFLTIPFTSTDVEAVGKRLNRGGGDSLEIPFTYCFYGQENIPQWSTKKLETSKKELECNIYMSENSI